MAVPTTDLSPEEAASVLSRSDPAWTRRLVDELDRYVKRERIPSVVSKSTLFVLVSTNDGSEAFAKPGDVGGLVLCAAGRFDDDRGVRVADRADEQLLRYLAVPEVGVPVAMAVERVA